MRAPIGFLFRGYNLPAPGANTGISGGVVPKEGRLRITVALSTSSVVNVTATDGTTTHKWGLSLSAALQAGDLYSWEFDVMGELTYDVEVETDSVIECLTITNPVGSLS